MNHQRVSGESLAETEPHMEGGGLLQKKEEDVSVCKRGSVGQSETK